VPILTRRGFALGLGATALTMSTSTRSRSRATSGLSGHILATPVDAAPDDPDVLEQAPIAIDLAAESTATVALPPIEQLFPVSECS